MKKRRFTTEDWVGLGLKELAAKGSEAIKLEAICKAAGLTRGSFYHHFPDHESFLAALAQHWFKTQTEDVAAAIDAEACAEEQGAALMQAAMNIDYKLELGIRELGRRLSIVGEIVRQADATRLAVVSKLYQDRYGLDACEADQFAYIEYAAFSGIILLDPEISAERQKALANLFDTTIARALSQKVRK